AALAVVLVWRGHAAFEIKAAVLVVATFLASPYAWDYDMVSLLFVAAWLGRYGARTGFLRWEQPLALSLVALPAAMFVVGLALSVQLAPVVLWLALGLLLRRFFAR